MRVMSCIILSQQACSIRASLQEEVFLSSEAMTPDSPSGCSRQPENLCHHSQQGALPSRALPCSVSLT